MRGVALDADSLGPGLDFATLRAPLDDWAWYGATDPDDVAERIADAAIVVSNKVPLDAAALARAPALRLICVAATGVNNIDLQAAGQHGITVCNATDYATPAVAQHTLALILALATRLEDYRASVRAGAWQQAPHFCLLDPPITELAGRTLGIVGFGTLGRAVADLGRALGMEVIVAARPGTGSDAIPGDRLPLPALLEQADVVSLHCPLTPATTGLIGARELARMRPDALLINTARGGIVDEPALADALRRGTIAGAGVDVLSAEPPRGGNPLLADDIPNLIVTPHCAWATGAARQRLVNQVGAHIANFLDGRPGNVVAGPDRETEDP